MAKLDDEDLVNIYNAVWFGRPGAPLIPNEANGNGEWPYTALGSMTARINRDIVTPAVRNMSAPDIAALVPDELVEAVAKGLAERLSK